MPPSHVVVFVPRRGPLLDPFAIGPPLSLIKKTKVFSSSPSIFNFDITDPTASSNALVIAA